MAISFTPTPLPQSFTPVPTPTGVFGQASYNPVTQTYTTTTGQGQSMAQINVPSGTKTTSTTHAMVQTQPVFEKPSILSQPVFTGTGISISKYGSAGMPNFLISNIKTPPPITTKLMSMLPQTSDVQKILTPQTTPLPVISSSGYILPGTFRPKVTNEVAEQLARDINVYNNNVRKFDLSQSIGKMSDIKKQTLITEGEKLAAKISGINTNIDTNSIILKPGEWAPLPSQNNVKTILLSGKPVETKISFSSGATMRAVTPELALATKAAEAKAWKDTPYFKEMGGWEGFKSGFQMQPEKGMTGSQSAMGTLGSVAGLAFLGGGAPKLLQGVDWLGNVARTSDMAHKINTFGRLGRIATTLGTYGTESYLTFQTGKAVTNALAPAGSKDVMPEKDWQEMFGKATRAEQFGRFTSQQPLYIKAGDTTYKVPFSAGIKGIFKGGAGMAINPLSSNVYTSTLEADLNAYRKPNGNPLTQDEKDLMMGRGTQQRQSLGFVTSVAVMQPEAFANVAGAKEVNMLKNTGNWIDYTGWNKLGKQELWQGFKAKIVPGITEGVLSTGVKLGQLYPNKQVLPGMITIPGTPGTPEIREIIGTTSVTGEPFITKEMTAFPGGSEVLTTTKTPTTTTQQIKITPAVPAVPEKRVFEPGKALLMAAGGGVGILTAGGFGVGEKYFGSGYGFGQKYFGKSAADVASKTISSAGKTPFLSKMWNMFGLASDVNELPGDISTPLLTYSTKSLPRVSVVIPDTSRTAGMFGFGSESRKESPMSSFSTTSTDIVPSISNIQTTSFDIQTSGQSISDIIGKPRNIDIIPQPRQPRVPDVGVPRGNVPSTYTNTYTDQNIIEKINTLTDTDIITKESVDTTTDTNTNTNTNTNTDTVTNVMTGRAIWPFFMLPGSGGGGGGARARYKSWTTINPMLDLAAIWKQKKFSDEGLVDMIKYGVGGPAPRVLSTKTGTDIREYLTKSKMPIMRERQFNTQQFRTPIKTTATMKSYKIPQMKVHTYKMPEMNKFKMPENKFGKSKKLRVTI